MIDKHPSTAGIAKGKEDGRLRGVVHFEAHVAERRMRPPVPLRTGQEAEARQDLEIAATSDCGKKNRVCCEFEDIHASCIRISAEGGGASSVTSFAHRLMEFSVRSRAG